MVIYKKLLYLRIYQEFYNQYSSRGLRVLLDNQSVELLRSYGLLFRSTTDGCVVLSNSESESLLWKLKKDLMLRLFIKVEDRFLPNYTKVDRKLGQSLYWFSNESQSSKEEPVRLHQDSFAGDRDVFSLLSPTMTLRSVVPEGHVKLAGEEAVIFEGEPSPSDVFSMFLDDRYGRYRVEGQDDSSTQLYYPEIPRDVFAVVELILSKDLFQSGQASDLKYEIRLDSRSVYWRYFFVSETIEKIEEIEVRDESGMHSFSEPALTTLINGRSAFQVTSMKPVQLSHRYIGDKLFATIKNSSSEYGGKRIRLPKPDTKRIKGIKEENGLVYFSEMYVTL